MEITILGTAAAEGWPAIFCDCDTCRRARKARGKNIRSRASIRIGQTHKIDFPPDAFYHEAVLGSDFTRLRHLFFTHSHGDHCDLSELVYLVPPFAHDNEPVLFIYGSAQAIEKIKASKAMNRLQDRCELIALRAFEPVQADDLTFTPIVAKHMSDEECFNYIVSDGSSSFLYTCDTGFYDEPTWNYLSGVKLDTIIAECTNGNKHQYETHSSLNDVVRMTERLNGYGTLNTGARVILTHFSHNCAMLHDELEAVAAPYGIEVGYDGMKVRMGDN